MGIPIPGGGNSVCIPKVPDIKWPGAEDADVAVAVPTGVTPGGWESGNGTEGRGIPCAGRGKGPGKAAGYGRNGSLGIPPICGGCNQSPWGGAIAGKGA